MDLCLLEHQMDAFGYVSYISISVTRKYPLREYILGVLTHTTAWDQLWGGDIFQRLYIQLGPTKTAEKPFYEAK